MSKRIDELATDVANYAIGNLSPEAKASFRDDEFGGKTVILEMKFSVGCRISQEASLFESRGHNAAAVLGKDLGLRLKESIVRYATTVCIKGGERDE